MDPKKYSKAHKWARCMALCLKYVEYRRGPRFLEWARASYGGPRLLEGAWGFLREPKVFAGSPGLLEEAWCFLRGAQSCLRESGAAYGGPELLEGAWSCLRGPVTA